MKDNYKDDQHTIYDMSNVGSNIKHKKADFNASKKETKAIVKAAFATYTPIFLLILLGFGIAILLVFLWLN